MRNRPTASLLALGLAASLAGAGAGAQPQSITVSQPADATTRDPGRSTQGLTVNYFARLDATPPPGSRTNGCGRHSITQRTLSLS